MITHLIKTFHHFVETMKFMLCSLFTLRRTSFRSSFTTTTLMTWIDLKNSGDTFLCSQYYVKHNLIKKIIILLNIGVDIAANL